MRTKLIWAIVFGLPGPVLYYSLRYNNWVARFFVDVGLMLSPGVVAIPTMQPGRVLSLLALITTAFNVALFAAALGFGSFLGNRYPERGAYFVAAFSCFAIGWCWLVTDSRGKYDTLAYGAALLAVLYYALCSWISVNGQLRPRR